MTATRPPRYWHGGAPDLRPGQLITPRPADDTSHLVDDCPTCQTRRAGQPLDIDNNDPDWVYITTDREYARLYAAGYPRGGLYTVEPIGELHDRSEFDPLPSWGVESARVLTVYDRCVVPTKSQMRRWARLGGVR